jgi:predicted outer membrane protein
MEGERPGRIVAVTLLTLLMPMTAMGLGMGTAAASGHAPPSPASAVPAALPGGGGAVRTVKNPTDQDFLVMVRQAALWQVPAGEYAREHASSTAVKDVGQRLIVDNTELDDEVRTVAARHGVALPNQASEEQQGWLADLAGEEGPDYDRALVNRLRATFGTILPVAAAVRSGTRDADVRTFATHVQDLVGTHMTTLESTGLVDFDALPEPALPALPQSEDTVTPVLGPATSVPPVTVAAGTEDGTGGVSPWLVVLVCVAEAGLTVGLVRFLRTR